jgi:glycosyltransferase involved in cell wall biosynthesis
LATHLRDKGENVSIILNQEILKFYNDLEGVEIFNIGYVYHHKWLIKSIIFRRPIIGGELNILNSFLCPYLNEFLRPLYFKRIEKEILNFILDKNVDVVQSNLENSDILVSCLNDLKIPWIGRIGGVYLRSSSIRSVVSSEKRKARMLKNALNKMDKIIFASTFLFNTFKDIVLIENKSVVILNGIKLSDFQRDSIPTLKLKGDFNLLFPGGPKPNKNGDLVIKALYSVKNEIQNIHLYIALNVPQNHLLRKMVKDLGLEQSVTFLGFLQKEKYKEFLNSVDVLVLPSKIEGFSLVNLEAMALGISIITSNRGAIPEFVANGRNGLLVEPKSDEIANAILYLYKSEDLRKEMSRNNLEDIKKFDWGHIVDKYIDVYRKTLEEKD